MCWLAFMRGSGFWQVRLSCERKAIEPGAIAGGWPRGCVAFRIIN